MNNPNPLEASATYTRALYLLRQAFGVEDEQAIQALLNPNCDQTMEGLALRLRRALLEEGVFVRVDRENIRHMIESESELADVTEEGLDDFIDAIYEDEFGPAHEELRDCVSTRIEYLEWDTANDDDADEEDEDNEDDDGFVFID